MNHNPGMGEDMVLLLGATIFLLLALPCAHAESGVYDIEAFGAVPDNGTLEASLANGRAVAGAVAAASSWNRGGRANGTVAVRSAYTIIPNGSLDHVFGVTLSLTGSLNAWPGAVAEWPLSPSGPERRFAVLQFFNATGVTITGGGVIVGNGYRWWELSLAGAPLARPNLISFYRCVDVTVEAVTLLNSPKYYVRFDDILGGLIQDVTIHTDTTAQRSLLRAHGKLSRRGVPLFPLNTDGIDVSGRHVMVRRCNVTNYDDALCAKPLDETGFSGPCTSNVTFEDSVIYEGVGASVGSVPPSATVRCIDGVTFRRLRFHNPIKMIYVKPNPNETADASVRGVISNVVYEDLHATGAQWWSVWVSTQQQDQPGRNGTNTGCSFFYPLPGTSCPLDPHVPVTNLTLRNILSEDAVFSPGVLRCSPAGPCTGWRWDNVTVTTRSGYPTGSNFVCEGLVDYSFTNVSAPCIGPPSQ
ncbi:hypothetical protein DIPPA_18674 [Diplonema papillatum]|nr:hypothetical protein DIPPA_18674 [Diplonema papillatum]